MKRVLFKLSLVIVALFAVVSTNSYAVSATETQEKSKNIVENDITNLSKNNSNGVVKNNIKNDISKGKKQSNKQNEKQKIVLQVATNIPFPPFEMMRNGKIVGIDMDILQEINKITGIQFEINDMSFNSIIASLNSAKVQMAIAGLSATDERREKVDFTDGYFKSHYSLIGNGKRFTNLKELYGKKVGVQTGTTHQEFLQQHNIKLKAKDKIEIIFFDDNYVGMESLINRKIDAILIDEMVANAFAKTNKNIYLT